MIRGFLVSIGFLASSVTFASSLICSGESLYLRSVSNDFGTRPQPGAVLGRETILMNGDVLQDYTRIEGLRPNGIPPYGTVFEDNAIVLENSGSHIAS